MKIRPYIKGDGPNCQSFKCFYRIYSNNKNNDFNSLPVLFFVNRDEYGKKLYKLRSVSSMVGKKEKISYVKVTFQLTKDQHEKLRKVSFDNRISISAILRDMVEKNLEEWESKYKKSHEMS